MGKKTITIVHLKVFLIEPILLFHLDKENVWRDVCNMGDEIPVNYDTIEQLFCQKEIAKSTTDGPLQKIIPTKVCFHVMPKTFYF